MKTKRKVRPGRSEPATKKAPVTAPALFKRINHALLKSGRQLRVTRTGRARVELGEFYVTDAQGVVASNVDIEALAREVGAMATWESLVE
jgi:hypothetical protein